MVYKDRTIQQLADKGGSIANKHAVVGLDGFIDRILEPVRQRNGRGADFEPFEGMAGFGQRIVDSAGESCNIELFPRAERPGGNGPIMATALSAFGIQTRYIGALGEVAVHPVFEGFARRCNAVSLCDPGITHALEFADGKVMLGTMASLDDISYERVIATMGEGAFFDCLNQLDLLALVNWTMIPGMSEFFEALLTRALPNLPPKDGGRMFYFDLADPKKRTTGELQSALKLISRFRSHGRAILGLNLAEAQQVSAALDLPRVENTPDSLRNCARLIRQKLDLHCVVIHPRDGAACATRDDSWYTPGPFCEKPRISTGAGDHFNAGFCCGQLIGLSPEACLTLAVTVSGHYVRKAEAPSLADCDSFLRNWKA